MYLQVAIETKLKLKILC